MFVNECLWEETGKLFDRAARPAKGGRAKLPRGCWLKQTVPAVPIFMRTTTLTFPELILIAATRGMLGAGIALLIAKRLSAEQRETAGLILTLIGALTTVPLAIEAFGKSQRR